MTELIQNAYVTNEHNIISKIEIPDRLLAVTTDVCNDVVFLELTEQCSIKSRAIATLKE